MRKAKARKARAKAMRLRRARPVRLPRVKTRVNLNPFRFLSRNPDSDPEGLSIPDPDHPDGTTGPRLVAGLGNPGTQYEQTRHNVGFIVLDRLAEHEDLQWERHRKFEAEITKRAGTGSILLKPQTFMNLSGRSVARATRFHKLNNPGDILVVFDDVSLPLGKLRFREGGSAGGHNGMRSIISELGTDRLPAPQTGSPSGGSRRRTDTTTGTPCPRSIPKGRTVSA